MTELARPLEVTLSSLQQELESLVASGFLFGTETVGAFILRQTPNLPCSRNSEGWSRRLAGLFWISKLPSWQLAVCLV